VALDAHLSIEGLRNDATDRYYQRIKILTIIDDQRFLKQWQLDQRRLHLKHENAQKKIKHMINHTINVREGILLGGRKKVALKTTICPKNKVCPEKTFCLIRMGPETLCKSVLQS